MERYTIKKSSINNEVHPTAADNMIKEQIKEAAQKFIDVVKGTTYPPKMNIHNDK